MSGGFVRIARFDTTFLAHLAAGRLEADGIAAFPVDDAVEGVPAGTVLFVPAEHARRALGVLAAPPDAVEADDGFEARSSSPPVEAAPERARAAEARCPSCGSGDVEEEPRLLPILPGRLRCLRCRTALPRRGRPG